MIVIMPSHDLPRRIVIVDDTVTPNTFAWIRVTPPGTESAPSSPIAIIPGTAIAIAGTITVSNRLPVFPTLTLSPSQIPVPVTVCLIVLIYSCDIFEAPDQMMLVPRAVAPAGTATLSA